MRWTRALVFPETPVGRSERDRAPFDLITSESWPPEAAITRWKDWIRGRIRDLDFVAPDLDFVAAGLVFISGSLDFVAAGLDFGSGPLAAALPPGFSAP
ncbi:MAG: hypothetical protein WB766_19675 [Roseiarcus sp.]